MPTNQPQSSIPNTFINSPQMQQQQNMIINNPNQNVKPVINTQQQQQHQHQQQIIQPNLQQQQAQQLQQQRNQIPQPINQQQQQTQYMPNQQITGPVSNQPVNVSGGPMLNTQSVGENDEAYKRKIEELRAHLPKIEKIHAISVGN
jgi:hypothetical protein